MNIREKKKEEKVIIYCRVSTPARKITLKHKKKKQRR
jgi:predicted site-specific integrase-resolvase